MQGGEKERNNKSRKWWGEMTYIRLVEEGVSFARVGSRCARQRVLSKDVMGRAMYNCGTPNPKEIIVGQKGTLRIKRRLHKG